MDFLDLIENSREPNNEYLRYWNGYILLLRPLLTIFNIEQIYKINMCLLTIFTTILLILFTNWKELKKKEIY